MSEPTNIGVDVDSLGKNGDDEKVARVVVTRAFAYTRDGGAPTISRNARDYRRYEREIQRLKQELDATLEIVREQLGGESAADESPGDAEPTPQRQDVVFRLAPDTPVADVMTRDVKTVRRNDSLSLVDELMRVGSFRHIVVLDDRDQVAGVISQRDIFYGALAWSLGLGSFAHEKSLAARRAKNVMQTDVITIDGATHLGEAASLMMKHKVGCLPVVNGVDLVGIITEGDFLALIVAELS